MSSFYGSGLLSSGGGSSDSAKVYSKTKEEWNSQRDLISEKNVFYVYTNYKTTDEGKNIPGLKIGDGLAYIIDLPFTAVGEQDLTQVFQHIRNAAIHVSAEDRQTWNSAVETVNNKVSVDISPSNPENIVFSW